MSDVNSATVEAQVVYFEIEKNVPLAPKKRKEAAPLPAFPFEQLNVGDSFFVPVEDDSRYRMQGKMLREGAAFLKTNGLELVWKLTTRFIDEPVKGIRLWRVI